MGAAPQVLPKENVMLAYQHKVPFYMPSMFTDINLFQANPMMERFCGHGVGKHHDDVPVYGRKNTLAMEWASMRIRRTDKQN